MRLCLFWIASGLALSLPLPAAAQDLQRSVENLAGSAKIGDARVGVQIIDLSTGGVLAALRATEGFIPASNMKLLTSGTAMSVLPRDFTFRTEIQWAAGTLIVRGSGDPGLGDPALLEQAVPAMNVRSLVQSLARAVKVAAPGGIERLVVDDRIFDRQYVHPAWPENQLQKYYCAEVAGVNFHTNVMTFFPGPSPDGPDHPPVVTLEPEAPWIEIENKGRTGPRGANSVWLQRALEANSFTIFGEIGPGPRVAADVSLHEPPVFFGRLLAAELLRAGVRVGPVRSDGDPSRGDYERAFTVVSQGDPGVTDARVIAAVSTHISDIYQRINTDSQNMYAESLLKRMGREVTGEPGSWSNGASIVRMTLAQTIGPDAAASTVVSDGSGMSRENRVSPRTMTRWLAALQGNAKFGGEFLASMAEPGEGTLRSRFRGSHLSTEVHAKSGKLDGVRCLSGFVIDPNTGRRVAFSVLVNDLKEGEQALQAGKLYEDIVKAIDDWLVDRRPVERPVKGG
ncbi:MAG: D-alanyl-D-alanine carboxypeptidase/D-alanyl-D-alanine-endopeptidase [Phycisphaerales bacterium]|nr:D-alanyl-D-alanine carboxypeptidase/D-alanyl-D-alanine-endopeptidase [Phycisphaerales bacterium]